MLMFYIQKQHKQPIPQLWINNIESRCGEMEESKKNPDRASIELCILAIGSLGNVFGARFEQTVLKSHIYTRWNQTSAGTRIIRTVICAVTLLLAFMASSVLFSKLFTPLIGQKQVFLWKRCVTFFGGNFAGLGMLRWISFKFYLINTEVNKHQLAKKVDSTTPKGSKTSLTKQKRKSK